MTSSALKIIQNDVAQSLAGRESLLTELRKDEIVITGGTGFVGTWLTEFLTFLNDEYSYDLQIHLVARDFEKFRESRPHLARHPRVHFIQSDIRGLLELPRNTSRIIHAAGNPDQHHHTSNPLDTMSVITSGTIQVLHAAMRCAAIRSILNISSGHVYGAQPHAMRSIPESFVGQVNHSCVSYAYAEAKRFSEMICAGYRSQNRLPVLNVRPFAFIGPYQRLDHSWAMNSFIRDALSEREIRVLGDGRIVRSYLYATDMAFAILRMAAEGVIGESYNLGGSEEVELKTLAEKIQAIVEPSSEIRYRVSQEDERRKNSFVPDMTKVKQTLGIEAQVNLDQALTRTINWHQQHPS